MEILSMKNCILIWLAVLCFSFSALGQNNEILYKAIIKNDVEKVTKLLNADADPNAVISSGSWMKVNMLITAVNNNNLQIAKLLIEKKADVNWKDGFKTTALMYAVSIGNKNMVTLLLDNGADFNANDGQGNTVLSAAKEGKNEEVIQIIENRIKSNK
jgi:ankyrin repeat protein